MIKGGKKKQESGNLAPGRSSYRFYLDFLLSPIFSVPGFSDWTDQAGPVLTTLVERVFTPFFPLFLRGN